MLTGIATTGLATISAESIGVETIGAAAVSATRSGARVCCLTGSAGGTMGSLVTNGFSITLDPDVGGTGTGAGLASPDTVSPALVHDAACVRTECPALPA